MAISVSTHIAIRGRKTAADVLTAHGYSVVKTETREGVTVRTWRKDT